MTLAIAEFFLTGYHGYDIDNLVSSESGSNRCRPANNAPPSADGPGGVDNAWGAHALPLISSVLPHLPTTANSGVRDGHRTTLIDIPRYEARRDLDMGALVHQGAELTDAPPYSWSTFDTPPLAVDGYSAEVRPTGAVAWVGRGSGVLELRLWLGESDLVIPIREPLITLEFGTGEGGELARNGILAGWVTVSELLTAIAAAATDSTHEFLCPGTPDFERIASGIRGAADLAADGSNGNPNEPCAALSVGIGFFGFNTLRGTAVPLPPPRDVCAPKL